jgi:stage III sporulation protein SpoIIIAA
MKILIQTINKLLKNKPKLNKLQEIRIKVMIQEILPFTLYQVSIFYEVLKSGELINFDYHFS